MVRGQIWHFMATKPFRINLNYVINLLFGGINVVDIIKRLRPSRAMVRHATGAAFRAWRTAEANHGQDRYRYFKKND